MEIQLKSPFKEIWRKGYLRKSKKDKRWRVDLVNSRKDRTTISYARYIICTERGEYLSENYEVDHIDKNCCNDSLDNLQVLSVAEHNEKSRQESLTGRTFVELVCPNCLKSFKKEKRQVKKGTTPKCSRKCNALYNIKYRGWCKSK